MTTKETLQKGQFGDMFVTTTGLRALFLRRAKDRENKYIFFYVEDWGTVQVFANTGSEVGGDAMHSIVGLYHKQFCT